MKKLFSFLWKYISTPYFISLCALIISAYTLWDAKLNFNLDVSAGRQTKLLVANIDKVSIRPAILMSLAFTNSGGRTSYLEDVKIKVTLISNNKEFWNEEFVALREYDTLLADPAVMKQTEILPIVVVGKTTEVRKYVFTPLKNIMQNNIPKSFDLDIEVYTKERNSWYQRKSYEIKNLSDIWQDLSNKDSWRTTICDIFEKN